MHLVFSTYARCKGFAEHCKHLSTAALPRTDSEQTTHWYDQLLRRAFLQTLLLLFLLRLPNLLRHLLLPVSLNAFCCAWWG